MDLAVDAPGIVVCHTILVGIGLSGNKALKSSPSAKLCRIGFPEVDGASSGWAFYEFF
jgi:hypothetical protein